MTNELVLYDNMRLAIRQCAAVDEAAGIRDVSARLEAYAKIRDDSVSQQRFAEIRLRACQRIGEISRDMEKAQGARNELLPVDEKKLTKAEELGQAGISTSTAQRYEELAGPKEEQAQKIVEAATDSYFAKQQEAEKPATMTGLLVAVEQALEASFGKRPRRPKIEAESPIDYTYISFIGPIREITSQDLDPVFLASEVREIFASDDVESCLKMISLLELFITETRKRYKHVFAPA